MGRFPKSWGYPQSPSILDWDFPWNKPSSYWGGVAPWLWTPPYVVITHCLVGDDTTWLRILMKDHQTWELSLKKDSSYLRWGTWWISWDLCTLQAHHGICVLFFKAIGSSPLSKRDYFLFLGKHVWWTVTVFFCVFVGRSLGEESCCPVEHWLFSTRHSV